MADYYYPELEQHLEHLDALDRVKKCIGWVTWFVPIAAISGAVFGAAASVVYYHTRSHHKAFWRHAGSIGFATMCNIAMSTWRPLLTLAAPCTVVALISHACKRME